MTRYKKAKPVEDVPLSAETVKIGMKVVTVVNAYLGERIVAEVVGFDQDDLDYGAVNVMTGDGFGPYYVRLRTCVPYTGSEPVGTVVGNVKAVPMPW